MSMQTIDAHHASITTATVAVKTLSIADKQMTLSVFRQLPTRYIPGRGIGFTQTTPREPKLARWIEPDITEVWGYVNYWWPGAEEPTGGGYHAVVLVLDSGLFRCIVPHNPRAHPNYGVWRQYDACKAHDARLEREYISRYLELTNHIYERGQLFIAV